MTELRSLNLNHCPLLDSLCPNLGHLELLRGKLSASRSDK